MNIRQTLSTHKYKLLTIALLLLLINYFYPVYNFYAHRGVLPLPPFGWEKLPENPPQQSTLYDKQFEDASLKVMALMESRRQNIGAPSFSAAVAMGGRLVWTGTTGWANIENAIPATSDTVYRVGSTSKAITATALAKLVQDGRLDLDAPISTYMENLPNPAWRHITARQLASHMAGLSHYGQKGLAQKDYLGLYQVMALKSQYHTMSDALAVFDGAALRSKPGTTFHYSSLGTVLLGAVMEAVTGKSYFETLKQELFTPLNLSSIVPAPTSSDGSLNIATSYLPGARAGRADQVRRWRPVNLSHRLPGGGLAASPSDLVRMGLGYFNPEYLSQNIVETFWTPQKLENGEINPQNYALGWRVREWEIESIGGVWAASHGGVSRGSQSLYMIIPTYQMVISFTANTNTTNFTDFGFLFKDIMREFISAY